ncbi:hypothetical protein LSAT2_023228 [Lamellibrachia satsuma]|nr:hypothetical protein LSAT2_023228 [Lamellibrachia satsuma]
MNLFVHVTTKSSSSPSDGDASTNTVGHTVLHNHSLNLGTDIVASSVQHGDSTETKETDNNLFTRSSLRMSSLCRTKQMYNNLFTRSSLDMSSQRRRLDRSTMDANNASVRTNPEDHTPPLSF